MVQFYSAKKSARSKPTLELTIADLDQFGQGVARYQGKTCFIAGALPGEKVLAKVVSDKRSFMQAKIDTLLQTSPQRMAPQCAVYGQCGGCQQQHISVELQQQAKLRGLTRLLSQATGQPIEVEGVLAAQAWHYRRRTRISLRWNKSQQRLEFGFRRQSSEQIVTVKSCPVLVPELETLLAPLEAQLNQLTAAKFLGHVELVAADNGVSMILRHLRALSTTDQDLLSRFADSHQLAIYLADEQGVLPLGTVSQPYYRVGDCQLYFQPQNFIQVNSAVNQQMVATAMEWLDLQPTDRVLDLFCGMGNFSLPIAKSVSWVTGVEGVDRLVRQAEYNTAVNGLTNLDFWQQDLEQDFSQQPWVRQGYTKVLLDPARAGAAGVLKHVIRLAPQKLVYVSCNPATLARDSLPLIEEGYQIERVTMLDMFPHTSHLESMVLFSRA